VKPLPYFKKLYRGTSSRSFRLRVVFRSQLKQIRRWVAR